MKAIHEKVATRLRNAKFKARLFNNKEMPHQPFEVRVKGITKEVAKELQQMMCNAFKNDLINIVEY